MRGYRFAVAWVGMLVGSWALVYVAVRLIMAGLRVMAV